MKKLLILFICVLSAWSSQGQTAEEKTLLDIETNIVEAIANHKSDFLSSLYDDSFHGVTPNGTVVNKAKWLELLNTTNPYVVFNTEEVKVSIFGTTAVVTGKLVGKSKSGTLIGQSRFIHVLIKHKDQWKIFEEQSTLIIEN